MRPLCYSGNPVRRAGRAIGNERSSREVIGGWNAWTVLFGPGFIEGRRSARSGRAGTGTMSGFQDRSIKSKLMWLTVLTSTIVLVLSGVASITYHLVKVRQNLTYNLSTLAAVIGTNSTAALTFNDPKAGEETLAALAAYPHVIAAAIYNKDGRVFSTFVGKDAPGKFIPPPLQDDLAGNCLFVNERWCEMTGLTPEEAKGSGWARALHPEDRERVTASLKEQARGEGTDIVYRVVRPDGSSRWVRDRSFPIRNRSGQVYRVAGIAEDITLQREAEEELKKKTIQDAGGFPGHSIRCRENQADPDQFSFERREIHQDRGDHRFGEGAAGAGGNRVFNPGQRNRHQTGRTSQNL